MVARKPKKGAYGEGGKRAQFLTRAAAVYGLSRDGALAAFTGRREQSVRLNPLSGRPVSEICRDLEQLCELEPIEWCPEAFFLVNGKAAAVASPLFRCGEIYVQNASSLFPVRALDPQPGEDILDLAASPGGKASHIAALTGNRGNLWLNDGLPARIGKLREVAGTMGVRAREITSFPAQYADRHITEKFDRILLDAQCSGEGRVNLGRSSSLKFWSLERVQEYGFLQQRMLRAAFQLLKPGGTLVYTTCTVSPEENESPVSTLISRTLDAEVDVIEINPGHKASLPGLTAWQGRKFDPRLSRAVRLRPARFFEAFFICKLRRAA